MRILQATGGARERVEMGNNSEARSSAFIFVAAGEERRGEENWDQQREAGRRSEEGS